jgi:5-methylcytosine-specific restriction endonuclease McrA
VPADVTYRNECDVCGHIWLSSTYHDACERHRGNDHVDGRTKERGEKYDSRHGRKFEEKRLEVLERDGHECRYCGMTNEEHIKRDDMFGVGLHVHHIIPTSEGGDHSLDNLVTVCAACHRREEA